MKRIAITLLLLACAVGAMAQDAEYQLIRREYTVNKDGTMDIRYRKEIKLLRNRAITAYADKGETFIVFNPAIDELRFNESYTIRPDGTRVAVPANGFVYQLPSTCTNCGRYNGLRECVVVHTALEYNCIVVLDYTIHRKSSVLDETIQLNQDCPVKLYEISVKLPQGQTLSVDIPNFNDTYKGKTQNGVYTLVAKNLKQTIADSYLPPAETLYPTVHLSNGRKASPQVNNFEPLPEANNLVGELHQKDPLAYITAIRDYVVDNVNYNPIPPALLGYQVASAKETFESNCGTLADKCGLLAALLRQAGFKATATGDQVVCTLYTNGKATNYTLSPIHKGAITPSNKQQPSRRRIEVAEDLAWTGENKGGGYRQMTLPKHPGALDMNPALLTSVRTAPVLVENGFEDYSYNIVLPRTPVLKLVKPVDIRYSVAGVGSLIISIQQDIHGVIHVHRQLKLDVEDGLVTPKLYKDFRQMMIDWNTYQTITIRPKKQ